MRIQSFLDGVALQVLHQFAAQRGKALVCEEIIGNWEIRNQAIAQMKAVTECDEVHRKLIAGGRMKKELDWMMPTNEYVEVHNGGYYVAWTRIGLDVVINDFRRGRSAKAIFEAYPSIGSLAKVYGAITFILEHPAEVEAYLKDQDRIFEEIKAQRPMPADMIERFERVKNERPAKLA